MNFPEDYTENDVKGIFGNQEGNSDSIKVMFPTKNSGNSKTTIAYVTFD